MKRLLFSFLFILTAIAGWAQEPMEFTEGHFNYVETNAENHYVSVAQNGDNQPAGAVVIPSSVTHDAVTYTVTSIADYGFSSNEDITEVTIPNTVTSIGQYAFMSCSKLTTITLPSTLQTINEGAFLSCSSLTSFSVPGSVTTIGFRAFDYCSITTFTFEASNIAITCSAAIPCTNLYLGRDITFTESGFSGVSALTIGTNVTNIGSLFFYISDITSVTVPWDSPITIVDYAFSDETFTNATLWIPGGTKAAYEAADGWKRFAKMDFSSFVVSITGSAHGTLAVGEIESTGGVEETTLIDRGKDAVFTVTPATGYEASTFTVNGEAAALTDNSYTVENLLADQTVVAGFTAINYTIGYDLAGGSVASANPATYTIESSAITLNNPTKTGYTFAGWTGTDLDKATLEVTIATGSTGNRSYTATWTPINYNIVYTLDGGTNNENNPATYTIESDAITLQAPTKTGYTFKGWKVNGEGEAVMSPTIAAGSTGDKAYTATWQVNQYTITFDSNGGSAVDAITQDYGTAVEAPADPTKTGYTFSGWDPEVPATIPAENITLTAQWTINQYTITFNTNGGTAIAPITQDYGTAVEAPSNPTKTGYNFNGWDAEIPETMPAENVTINATWTAIQYTISYNLDGGAVAEANPTSYTIEDNITLNNPTKTGYTFAGWTGTGLAEATTTVTISGLTGNRSYTATWAVETYTVTITGGGVTADNTTPEYGDNVVLTIMDDPDAELISLTVNGNDVTSSIVENHYTISGVTGNVNVVATWNSTKEFITLGSDIATFSCTQDLNFTGSELKAYIAAGFSKDGGTVLLVRVYDVPANTGLVIKGTQGYTYKIPYSTSMSYFVNMLKAHTTADAVPVTEGDYTNFILQKNGENYVWNHKTAGEMSLGAKKAYLQLPTSFVSSSAREMSMIFEDELTPTEIRDNYILLQESKYNGRIYNVSGQQIKTLQKGVNIVNGRKILK